MIDSLLQLDQDLFLFLNGIHNSIFDTIMYWASHKFFWVPFYALLLYLLVKHYGWKTAGLMALTIIITFAITNTVSTEVFKKGIQRLRPTHNPTIAHLVHIVNDHRGGYYGFFSSHASNVFGLAVLMGLFLKPNIKWMLFFMLVWAAMISYSRIYLGVHYPLDILCGAIFGILTAGINYKLYIYFVQRKNKTFN